MGEKIECQFKNLKYLRIDYCDACPFGSALFKFRYLFRFEVYYSLLYIIE